MKSEFPYPPGATNANWVSLFNAISFQVTLGAPMILYVKTLGGSATVLGVVAAMTPLLTTAQIPAARFLIRTGYRKFIFMGWRTRSIFIFAIALVPLLTFLSDLSKVALLLFCLFIFNLLRGIASGAWLPWLTDLIPENVRGRFLSRDQVFLHLGSLLAMLLSAAMLRGSAAPWQFSAIFFVSGLAAVAGLLFLRRLPDIVAGQTLTQSNTPVPWREIVSYPPFLRLTLFTLLWVCAVGSVGVFAVAFLKTSLGFSESKILYLTAVYFAGAMVSLPFVGRLVDRTGSKAVLQCAIVVSIMYHAAFCLLAARVAVPALPLLMALQFVNGMAGANFALAHVRLTMNTMPAMGRSHFFAFFSVIASLASAATPLVWGLVLDAIGPWEKFAGIFSWNRFSVFYACVTVLLVSVGLFSIALRETRGGGTRADARDTVFRETLRRLLRLGQR